MTRIEMIVRETTSRLLKLYGSGSVEALAERSLKTIRPGFPPVRSVNRVIVSRGAGRHVRGHPGAGEGFCDRRADPFVGIVPQLFQ
jgi:hypothetical protein